VKVLVVGYTADVLKHTTGVFRENGCDVVCSLGSGSALEELARTAISAVLLDRSVPELSKLLLSRRILDLYPTTRLIVTTDRETDQTSFPPGCVFVPNSASTLEMLAYVFGSARPQNARFAVVH
jgi:DNA-binding response OmpR family regulator